MTGLCQIRAMTEADLPQVLAWRNHPDIRRFMLTQHEISLREHRRWYAQAHGDATRRLLIVEHADQALGFVQFNGVAPGGSADWGFYATPDAARGSGQKLGRTALAYAFQTLQLQKVCGQALAFNQASIRFHLGLGFVQEQRLPAQHRSGQTPHDLLIFGLQPPPSKAP